MPRSSVIVRSLAVVSLGLVAVPAFGQSANVMAFNPYGGAGASSGSAPAPVYAVPPGASAGMAFNPWNPDGGAAAGGAYAGRGNAPSPYATGSSSYGGGSYGARLPDPPPGPIESRLTAVPERPARSAAPPPRTAAVAAPPPAPAVVEAPAAPAVVEAPAAPAPAPMVITPRTPAPAPAPVVATPAPTPPPAAVTPAPAPPPKVASVAPPPRPEPTPAAPAPASVMASVTFVPQSAEIGPAARAELDRVAQNTKSVRAIELRAYASGSDPIEARKVALARALAVRSYLIDQNVKIRIEVGAFASTNGGGERVDVLAP